MKQPWEWNEDDILELISNQVRESVELDYKACGSLAKTDGKKKEISKDVSAFANSAGGTIVYGVVEDAHVPTEIDSGFDPNDITKEWLEQVINSTIHRRIDGVRIKQIALPNTQPAKVLYVVSIPESNRAPHMALDKRYYKRFNFESVPMEEYEVRDAARRGETPDLRIIFGLPQKETPLKYEGDAAESQVIQVIVSITNNASQPAEYVLMRLFVDKRLAELQAPGGWRPAVDADLSGVNASTFSKNWGVPITLPIWEGVQFKVANLNFKVPKGVGKYLLGWDLKSPHMVPKMRFVSLMSNGDFAQIVEE